jgi:DNA-binding SARP family transcriptional activator/predicted ATPase
MPSIAIHLLGSPYIQRDGHLVHVDTRKAIALLAYLAATPGYQSRDTLATLLWGESDQSSARGALRRTLSALNSALEGAGLSIEREAIAFDAGAVWCDVTRFAAALRSIEPQRHPPPNLQLEQLTQAVELYTGDFLQGFSLRDSAEFDEWQFQQAEYLRRAYSAALDTLIELHGAAGRYGLAIDLAGRLLALDPLHERSHRHLMQLYTQSGQRQLALRQYQDCVRILDQELGVLPLEETVHLYQSLLKAEAVDPIALVETAPDPHSIERSPAVLPLVGRETESRQLAQVVDRTRKGNPTLHLVVIEGEAGIGKSRLVENFLQRAAAGGSRSLLLRCYENEGQMPFAALIRALQPALTSGSQADALPVDQLESLSRLIPSLRPSHLAPAQPPLDARSAQSRLFEAICAALLCLLEGPQPAICIFEDVQWMDSASVDVLAHLLRRPTIKPIIVIMTWRTEDIPRTHRLRSLLTEHDRNRSDSLRVVLQRLDVRAVSALVGALGLAQDGSLATRLHRESEGLPLFLNEYLNLIARGQWDLPPNIVDLVRSRLTHLSATAAQVLDAAAVLGRSFDLDLLELCSGRSDSETADALDELLRRGLLRETGETPAACEFTHDKLREVVYGDTSLLRRWSRRRRSAQAFISRVRQPDQLALYAAQIAQHYQAGGQDADASEYFYLAGTSARRLYANREALAHFEMALGLGYPQVALTHQQMGDLNLLLGHYSAAIQHYTAAAAHAEDALYPALEHALGKVHHRLGEWEIAERHYQASLQTYPASARTERAALLTDWSLTELQRGQIDSARQLMTEALALATASDAPYAIAQAHNLQGILARRCGQFPEAFAHLQASARIAESLGDPGIHAAALNNLALTHADCGAYEQAESLFRQALDQCRRQGDQHHQAALHNNLADLFHAMGQPDAAMTHLKQAVQLFAQVGSSAEKTAPEIWKLAEW